MRNVKSDFPDNTPAYPSFIRREFLFLPNYTPNRVKKWSSS